MKKPIEFCPSGLPARTSSPKHYNSQNTYPTCWHRLAPVLRIWLLLVITSPVLDEGSASRLSPVAILVVLRTRPIIGHELGTNIIYFVTTLSDLARWVITPCILTEAPCGFVVIT